MPGYDPQEGDRISPVPPVGEPRGVRRLLRLAAMDLAPLRRRRDFRLLFVGQGLSFFGSMLTYVAIPYQAYDLTGSTLVLGLLAAVELPPILLAAFVGGALADAVDRRRLVQLAEIGLAAWIVFDTLGDDVPGGIVIEELESSVHGPHPGFAEDFPFCEIAAELTGA